MEDTKNEQVFVGVTLFDVLKEIDALQTETATEIRGIVYSCEQQSTSIIEKRRNKQLDELVRLGYLREFICDKEILNQKYTRDKLFMELSKKTYDFQPNSNTTKREMIEYILANEKATKRLARKYFSATYTKEFEPFVKELGELLNQLIIKHPYKTTEIKLVDFYNELHSNREKEKREFDSMIDNITKDSRDKTEKKTSWFSKLFRKP